MAIYAIGDIHGCFTALKTAFESAGVKSTDTVIFLGDYIDRGPQSKETIDWILQKSKEYNFITLRGNHEIMMLEARSKPYTMEHWLFFGGSQTLFSYGFEDDYSDWTEKIPAEHWDFLSNTQPFYEYENFIFVHAGLTSGISLQEQSDDSIYWTHRMDPSPYSENKIILCGHTPRKDGNIANFGHTVCIDTFAFGGQWLSLLDVTSGKFRQGNQKGETRSGEICMGKQE